jgi:hypothetical protein
MKNLSSLGNDEVIVVGEQWTSLEKSSFTTQSR